MKHKNIFKNRFITMLFTMLCCIVMFGSAVITNFRAYAEKDAGQANAYAATAGGEEDATYELTSVTLSLTDGWFFTKDTPEEMLYKLVTVTVAYDNVKADPKETESYPLVLSDRKEGDAYVAKSGEKVTFAQNKGESSTEVTVNVTPKEDAVFADKVTGEKKETFPIVTVSEENPLTQTGIIAKFVPSDSFKVNSGTNVTNDLLSHVDMFQTYNDGTTTLDKGGSRYTLSGNFFPEDFSNPTEYQTGGAKHFYSKELLVTANYDNSFTTTVEWGNIEFQSPDEVVDEFVDPNTSSIPSPQFARSELDITGALVTLTYKGNRTIKISVPLSSFHKDTWKKFYYSDTDASLPVDNFTTAVKVVKITFKYPEEIAGNRDVEGLYDIDVSRLPIHVPSVPNTDAPISWNGTASIAIGNWDYETLYENDPPQIVIKATNEVDGSPEDGVTTSLADGTMTVTFPRAGVTYALTITLIDGKTATEQNPGTGAGDFQWDNPPSYMTVEWLNDYQLKVIVQVEKGTPVATLSGIGDVEYGQTNPTGEGTLTTTIEGKDLVKPWSYVKYDAANSATYEKWKTEDVWHYYLEFYTDANAAPASRVTGDKLLDSGLPKYAGTYYAVAVTYENSGYVSVRSDAADDAKPLDFNITKLQIQTGTPVTKTYDRAQSWTISQLFSVTTAFPYGDDVTNVLNISKIENSAKESVAVSTSFHYADAYTATFTLRDTRNYKLNEADSTTSGSFQFAITTYTESTFDFKVSSWVYGTAGANPNPTILTKSDKYYPSDTGNVNTDFTVEYFHYDGSKPNHVGTPVPITSASQFESLGIGLYVIKLTANAASDAANENPATTAGTTVSYTLPVEYREFEVTSSPILAPYLKADTDWTFGSGTEKEVYAYNDKNAAGKVFELQQWITNNVAADGRPIITVTVTYTLWITGAKGSFDTAPFSNGEITVNKAGHYVVTIELNSNYSWEMGDFPYTLAPNQHTYQFIGYVSRQKLNVLTDGDITGDESVYNGASQQKEVGGWNERALQISAVTGKNSGGNAISDGITTPDNAAVTTYSNLFSVTYAGTYTVSVEIADPYNYVWQNTTTEQPSALSLTYTLEQAILQVAWKKDNTSNEKEKSGTTSKSGDYWKYMFSGTDGSEQQTPVAIASGNYGEDDKAIVVESYTYYQDGAAFASEITRSGVNKRAFYFIAVKKIIGTAAANYKLPAPLDERVGTIFEITPYLLDAPQDMSEAHASLANKTITEFYARTTYDVTKYIYNYGTYTVGKQLRVEIAISGEGTLLNANVYTITLTLKDAENFAWREGVEDYTFTFEIKQKVIEINWTKLTVVYDPAGIPTAGYTLNTISPDEVELDLVYTKDGQSGLKDAGRYTVEVKGLTGADSKNYTLTGTESELRNPFTVQKMWVEKPTLPRADSEFNGKSGFRTITFAPNYDKANVQIVIKGEVPSDWFSTAPQAAVTFPSTTLDFKAGTSVTFTYTRAGAYTFTLSLDAKNYYWDGDSKEEDFDYNKDTYTYTVGAENGKLNKDAFIVDRKEIKAPSIEDYRAQEWDKEKIKKMSFTGSIDGISYDVDYGVKGAEPSSKDMLQFDGQGNGVQGVYYVQLTMTVEQVLNYVWIENDKDINDGSGYLRNTKDIYYYTYSDGEGWVAVRLFYAITLGQLKVGINVKSYEFGENGWVNGKRGTASYDQSAPLGDLASGNIVYLTGDDLGKLNETAVLTDVQFTSDSGSDFTIVNGLPWEVGSYKLSGVLHFGEGKTYQDIGILCSFSVTERTIEKEWIEWSNTSTEYKNESQMATATLRNVIQQSPTDSTDYRAGLKLVVGLENGNDDPTNAGAYTVKIVGLNEKGTLAFGNFKLPAAALTSDFEITAKAVTIKGRAVEGHIYGDVITEKNFDFISGSFFDDKAAEHVVVEICAYGTKTPIDQQYAPVGTYYVYVGWDDDTATYAKNYAVTFLIDRDTAATFEIVARVLTIEWKSSSANGVYGSVVDLYDYLDVKDCNSTGDPYAGKQRNKVVSFTVLLEGKPATLDTNAVVAVYTVVPGRVDTDNWVIDFVGSASWTYEVTNATITEAGDSFTLKSELKYIADWQTIFANKLQIVLVNESANYNDSTWEYGFATSESEDPSLWQESDVASWKDIKDAKNVSVFDAGKYFLFIRIKAKNHNDFIKKMIVEVEKAKLTVQFDFTIMYGEDNPASRGYQFGLDAIRAAAGNHWKVTGFIENSDDEDLFYNKKKSGNNFYELQGDGQYAVQDFPTWDWNHATALSTYAIVYRGAKLTCKNYDFKELDGTLTIAVIKIKVTGKTVKVTYNQPTEGFPAYKTEGVGYDVKHPASSYGGATYQTDATHYTGLIKVSSEAFDNPNEGSTTSYVGNHTLKVQQQKNSYIYELECVEGTVVVSAAELPKYEIAGYNEAYDERYHGISVDGINTVNNSDDPKNPWSWNASAFRAASDGTAVTVEFWVVDRQYEESDLSDSLLDETLAKFKLINGAKPSYIDRETYCIIYRITATNYQTVYGYREIVINVGKNTLTEDFKFAQATVYPGETTIGNVETAAWIYGYGVENGFEPTGKHAITNPKASYRRVSESYQNVGLKFGLWYYADTNSKGSLISKSDGEYTDADALFKALFAVAGFNAGIYRLEVYMTFDKSVTLPNFTFKTVNYWFRVAQRELSITVDSEFVYYGQAAPAKYKLAPTGLVPNAPEAEEDSVQTALNGGTPEFLSDYQAGDDAKNYAITVRNKGSLSSTNYIVTYPDGTLEVRKRLVTITIGDKSATYNESRSDDGKSIEELSFTVTLGTGKFNIYEKERDKDTTTELTTAYTNANQTLLTLYTNAIKQEDGRYVTNDVKWTDSNHTAITYYTIYAVFNSAKNENNYEIAFTGCNAAETSGEGSGVIPESGHKPIGDGTSNAGKYTLDRATAEIVGDTVLHMWEGKEVETECYTGLPNYMNATLADRKTKVDVTYTKDGVTTDTMIDAGTYQVNCVSTDWNYRPGKASWPYTLAKATLLIKANATEVQYGTELTKNVQTDLDEGIVKPDRTGRFLGFTYTVSSLKDILQKELDVYIKNEGGKYVRYETSGYTVNTSVAGQSAIIYPVCTETNNITFVESIDLISDTLTITKRQVSINILGWGENKYAYSDYLGGYKALNAALADKLKNHPEYFISHDSDLFGASDDDYSDLAIELLLDTHALDVGTYNIDTYRSTSKDYSVTFLNVGGTLAKFDVQKAKLTLYAYDTSTSNADNAYSVVYGETIERTTAPSSNTTLNDKILRYSVAGMVTGESLATLLGEKGICISFTITKGGSNYVAWESGIGMYTVSIIPLTKEQLDALKNYTIEATAYNSATLEITQRTVSATTANQTFSFGDEDNPGTDYHEGKYGINHVAAITYKDEYKSAAQVNSSNRPKADLTYAMQNNTEYYLDSFEAPNKVGDYTVTVTLPKNGNYKFESGYAVTLNYSVTKKTVTDRDLSWASTSIPTDNLEGDLFSNIIRKYRSGYLKVVSFVYVPLSGNPVDINFDKQQSAGSYFFDANGALNIKLDKRQSVLGQYTVRIELLEDAKYNVDLVSVTGTTSVDFVTPMFTVTNKQVKMTVEFGDFYYNEQPGMPLVHVDGSETDKVTLGYAVISSTENKPQTILDLYNLSKKNLGLMESELGDLKYGSLSISTKFVAGYYLLSVYCADVSQTRYYVFEVKQALLTAPKIDTKALTITYDGAEHSIELKYNANELIPTLSGIQFTGTSTRLGVDKVKFTVLNADTYTIRLTLIDTANTKWNPETLPSGATLDESNNAVVIFVWKVLKDTSEDNHDEIIKVPALIDNIVYGDAYNKSRITTALGYNGSIELFIHSRTDDNRPDANDGGWVAYDPAAHILNAGSYWIKAVLSDSMKTNFADKIGYGKFVILPRTITAYVTGTITYGDSLSATMLNRDTIFSPMYEGLRAEDGNQVEAIFGQYSYDYVDGSDDTVMAGGVYYIRLATDGLGYVVGINVISGNYVVTAVDGRLYVNKRNVTVSVEDQEGYYAAAPSNYLSQEAMANKYSVYPLPARDTKEALNIRFFTSADATSGVGTYLITIEYDNTNYIVSYQPALYTIKPLEVQITLEAQTDIFYDGHAVEGASFDADDLEIDNPFVNKDDIVANLKKVLKLHYTGISYRTGSYDSDKAPVDAGVYTAQVTGAGDNYTLIGSPSVEFTIQKQFVYNSTLCFADQTYTGSALTPVLGVTAGAGEGILSLITATIVSYTNAGTYQLIITLKDADNYQWENTQDAFVTVPFTINKADDALLGELIIRDWQYGRYSSETNSPEAMVKSGSAISFEYSTDGVNFSNIVPDTGSVGVYYVRVVVAESENYNAYISDPVPFRITKYNLAVPEIIESDGTFTGSELTALISNYDARYMSVMDESEARTFVGAASITAVAVNAGVYKIYIAINDFANCGWLDGAGDNAGVLTLTWTIGKMKVALPTAGKNSFVVNGNEIVYLPEGFDESIMLIENNKQSYGGNFTAVVTLKDTSNYEWADGSIKVELAWHITGSNTVLAVILSVLALCAVAGAVGIATQVLLDKRRKRTEAEALAEIESKDLAEGENHSEAAAAEEAGDAAEEAPEEKTEEQSEDKPEEKTEEQSEDTPEEKTEEQSEDKPEEKAEEQSEDKPEEKTEEQSEEKSEEKTEEQSEEKSEEKTEEQSEDKPEEKAEDKPKPKPKQKSPSDSKSKKGGND